MTSVPPGARRIDPDAEAARLAEARLRPRVAAGDTVTVTARDGVSFLARVIDGGTGRGFITILAEALDG